MAREWVRHCKGDGRLSVDGDDVVVSFANGRTQKVRVHQEDDTMVLETVVAKASVFDGLETRAEFEAWNRNRKAKLLHHWVDRRGRLCARAVLPDAVPGKEEFLLHLFALGEAADRWELHLTGDDAY